MSAFVVIDIIKRRAEVGHHKCVRGKNRGGNRRGSINGKEGADSREMMADFSFLNVKKASNVLDHLFVRERQFVASGAIQRRGGYNVRGVASAIHGRRRAGRNEDGGG